MELQESVEETKNLRRGANKMLIIIQKVSRKCGAGLAEKWSPTQDPGGPAPLQIHPWENYSWGHG